MDNQTPTAGRRYSAVAMILHWAIAIGVIVNWRIAEAAEHVPQAERGAAMAPHFAIGMMILVLTVALLVWRLFHKPPPLGSHLATWERILAKGVHHLFYALLLVLPLLGWLGMSGYGQPINMFGIVWPVLPVGFGKETGHEMFEVHGSIGGAMILLVGLHIIGALKHQFLDKDGELWKMLPFGTPKA